MIKFAQLSVDGIRELEGPVNRAGETAEFLERGREQQIK